jgi:thiamine-monophosphate kinase
MLFVTGRLGGSLAGRHLDFRPRLAEARWLVSHFQPHAMMDLSDGLAADLPRLAAASGCGYAIEESRLPCAPGCTAAQAMADGEDYELLFALAPRTAAALEAAWKQRFPRLRLTRIGTLERRTQTQTHGHGYDHFAKR